VRRTLLTLATLALLAPLAAGCGGGGGGGGGGEKTSASSTAETTTESTSTEETTGTTTAPPPARITVLSAALTPASVTGKGAPGATGTLVLRLNPRAGTACWTITMRGVVKPISAHVHDGKAGKLGPVVIPLGDRFAKRGCVLTPVRSLNLVSRSPGAYYADVHTTQYLNGAVRGQLRRGTS
jgi:hypothetical protein